jgi:CTP:phosphocholine cytidylyltransferase-like protein
MVIVGGYKHTRLNYYKKKYRCPFKRVHDMPEHEDDDVDLPIKWQIINR